MNPTTQFELYLKRKVLFNANVTFVSQSYFFLGVETCLIFISAYGHEAAWSPL